MRELARRYWKGVAIAAVVSLVLLLAHRLMGTPEGYSYRHNMPWFSAFYDAFWSGDLYPRRLGELWYGMGGLDFYFYGPMPFWIASLLGPIGCAGCDSGEILAQGGAWMVILSAGSFYILAQRFFAQGWAFIGSGLYAFLPYHYLVDWYVRQAIGELAALIFLPLLVLAVIDLLEKRGGGVLLALSFAGIVLSHLPTALLVAHFLVIVVVWKARAYWREPLELWRHIAPFAIWGLAGTLLTAIYWLPALMLLNDISSDMLFNGYATPTNWLFLDGRPEPNPVTAGIVKVNLLATIAIGGVAIWLLRGDIENPRRDTVLFWLLAPLGFGVFLMTPLSSWVWTYWILSSVQFPWRVMILLDVGLALAVTAIIRHCVLHRQRLSDWIGPALVAALGVVLAFGSAIPHAVNAAERGIASGGAFPMAGAPEYIPPATMDGVRDQFRETVQSDSTEAGYSLLFGLIEETAAQAHAQMREDAPNIEITETTGNDLHLSFQLNDFQMVRLPIPFWKYWEAERRNGEPVVLVSDPERGMLAMALPAGYYDIRLQLKPTGPERVGTAMSGFAAFLLIMLAYWSWRLRASPVTRV